MLNRPLLALGALLLLAAGALAADIPTYAIKFERPAKVGDSFNYSATHSIRVNTLQETPDGQKLPMTSVDSFAMDAQYDVLKVDAVGQETAVKLTIKKITQQSNDAPAAPLMAVGTEITITHGQGSISFAQKGGQLGPAGEAALKQFFSAHGKVSNDERYGTPERKKVGDAWPINSKDIASAMATVVDPAKITGAVTFKAIKTVNNVECAQIETRVTMRDLPDASHPKEFTVTTVILTDLPTDIAHAPVGSAAKIQTHQVNEQQLLGHGVFKTTVDKEISHVVAWTPLNK